MEAQEIRLVPCQWSDEIAEHLQRACIYATRADLKAQADRGAQCYAIEHAGEVIGAYMLRVDQPMQGPEGVIVAASGHIENVELLETVYPAIEAQFARAGCKTMRIHTARPGIARMMGARGFNMAEIVLSKVLQTC